MAYRGDYDLDNFQIYQQYLDDIENTPTFEVDFTFLGQDFTLTEDNIYADEDGFADFTAMDLVGNVGFSLGDTYTNEWEQSFSIFPPPVQTVLRAQGHNEDDLVKALFGNDGYQQWVETGEVDSSRYFNPGLIAEYKKPEYEGTKEQATAYSMSYPQAAEDYSEGTHRNEIRRFRGLITSGYKEAEYEMTKAQLEQDYNSAYDGLNISATNYYEGANYEGDFDDDQGNFSQEKFNTFVSGIPEVTDNQIQEAIDRIDASGEIVTDEGRLLALSMDLMGLEGSKMYLDQTTWNVAVNGVEAMANRLFGTEIDIPLNFNIYEMGAEILNKNFIDAAGKPILEGVTDKVGWLTRFANPDQLAVTFADMNNLGKQTPTGENIFTSVFKQFADNMLEGPMLDQVQELSSAGAFDNVDLSDAPEGSFSKLLQGVGNFAQDLGVQGQKIFGPVLSRYLIDTVAVSSGIGPVAAAGNLISGLMAPSTAEQWVNWGIRNDVNVSTLEEKDISYWRAALDNFFNDEPDAVSSELEYGNSTSLNFYNTLNTYTNDNLGFDIKEVPASTVWAGLAEEMSKNPNQPLDIGGEFQVSIPILEEIRKSAGIDVKQAVYDFESLYRTDMPSIENYETPDYIVSDGGDDAPFGFSLANKNAQSTVNLSDTTILVDGNWVPYDEVYTEDGTTVDGNEVSPYAPVDATEGIDIGEQEPIQNEQGQFEEPERTPEIMQAGFGSVIGDAVKGVYNFLKDTGVTQGSLDYFLGPRVEDSVWNVETGQYEYKGYPITRLSGGMQSPLTGNVIPAGGSLTVVKDLYWDPGYKEWRSLPKEDGSDSINFVENVELENPPPAVTITGRSAATQTPEQIVLNSQPNVADLDTSANIDLSPIASAIELQAPDTSVGTGLTEEDVNIDLGQDSQTNVDTGVGDGNEVDVNLGQDNETDVSTDTGIDNQVSVDLGNLSITGDTTVVDSALVGDGKEQRKFLSDGKEDGSAYSFSDMINILMQGKVSRSNLDRYFETKYIMGRNTPYGYYEYNALTGEDVNQGMSGYAEVQAFVDDILINNFPNEPIGKLIQDPLSQGIKAGYDEEGYKLGYVDGLVNTAVQEALRNAQSEFDITLNNAEFASAQKAVADYMGREDTFTLEQKEAAVTIASDAAVQQYKDDGFVFNQTNIDDAILQGIQNHTNDGYQFTQADVDAANAAGAQQAEDDRIANGIQFTQLDITNAINQAITDADIPGAEAAAAKAAVQNYIDNDPTVKTIDELNSAVQVGAQVAVDEYKARPDTFTAAEANAAVTSGVNNYINQGYTFKQKDVDEASSAGVITGREQVTAEFAEQGIQFTEADIQNRIDAKQLEFDDATAAAEQSFQQEREAAQIALTDAQTKGAEDLAAKQLELDAESARLDTSETNLENKKSELEAQIGYELPNINLSTALISLGYEDVTLVNKLDDKEYTYRRPVPGSEFSGTTTAEKRLKVIDDYMGSLDLTKINETNQAQIEKFVNDMVGFGVSREYYLGKSVQLSNQLFDEREQAVLDIEEAEATGVANVEAAETKAALDVIAARAAGQEDITSYFVPSFSFEDYFTNYLGWEPSTEYNFYINPKNRTNDEINAVRDEYLANYRATLDEGPLSEQQKDRLERYVSYSLSNKTSRDSYAKNAVDYSAQRDTARQALEDAKAKFALDLPEAETAAAEAAVAEYMLRSDTFTEEEQQAAAQVAADIAVQAYQDRDDTYTFDQAQSAINAGVAAYIDQGYTFTKDDIDSAEAEGFNAGEAAGVEAGRAEVTAEFEAAGIEFTQKDIQDSIDKAILDADIPGEKAEAARIAVEDYIKGDLTIFTQAELTAAAEVATNAANQAFDDAGIEFTQDDINSAVADGVQAYKDEGYTFTQDDVDTSRQEGFDAGELLGTQTGTEAGIQTGRQQVTDEFTQAGIEFTQLDITTAVNDAITAADIPGAEAEAARIAVEDYVANDPTIKTVAELEAAVQVGKEAAVAEYQARPDTFDATQAAAAVQAGVDDYISQGYTFKQEDIDAARDDGILTGTEAGIATGRAEVTEEFAQAGIKYTENDLNTAVSTAITNADIPAQNKAAAEEAVRKYIEEDLTIFTQEDLESATAVATTAAQEAFAATGQIYTQEELDLAIGNGVQAYIDQGYTFTEDDINRANSEGFDLGEAAGIQATTDEFAQAGIQFTQDDIDTAVTAEQTRLSEQYGRELTEAEATAATQAVEEYMLRGDTFTQDEMQANVDAAIQERIDSGLIFDQGDIDASVSAAVAEAERVAGIELGQAETAAAEAAVQDYIGRSDTYTQEEADAAAQAAVDDYMARPDTFTQEQANAAIGAAIAPYVTGTGTGTGVINPIVDEVDTGITEGDTTEDLDVDLTPGGPTIDTGGSDTGTVPEIFGDVDGDGTIGQVAEEVVTDTESTDDFDISYEYAKSVGGAEFAEDFRGVGLQGVISVAERFDLLGAQSSLRNQAAIAEEQTEVASNLRNLSKQSDLDLIEQFGPEYAQAIRSLSPEKEEILGQTMDLARTRFDRSKGRLSARDKAAARNEAFRLGQATGRTYDPIQQMTLLGELENVRTAREDAALNTGSFAFNMADAAQGDVTGLLLGQSPFAGGISTVTPPFGSVAATNLGLQNYQNNAQAQQYQQGLGIARNNLGQAVQTTQPSGIDRLGGYLQMGQQGLQLADYAFGTNYSSQGVIPGLMDLGGDAINKITGTKNVGTSTAFQDSLTYDPQGGGLQFIDYSNPFTAASNSMNLFP